MAKRQPKESSRANRIRARRQQSRKESQPKSFGTSATRKQNKRRVPVTRRPTSTTPMVNRKHRKVHVPLKSKGAEVFLPAFPRLNLGWRLISAAIVILSLAVIFSFTSLSAFEVNAVNLLGAQRLSGDAILSQVDLEGKAIIALKPDEIAESISASFPSLSRVRVSAGLPASVAIKVVEREPLILWQQGDTPMWVDAEGVMFPVRGEAPVALTVIANGDPPGPTVEIETENEQEIETLSMLMEPSYPSTTPEFVEGMLSLRTYVPENSHLQYDPQFGLGWQDPQGWSVYFGRDTRDIDIKLAEYQTIINALQKENITPSLISLEFMHAPFYRLEP